MRLNRFIALCSSLSRRAADQAILDGRVSVNGNIATVSTVLHDEDSVTLDEKVLQKPLDTQTILLYKPAGYVVSTNGQGSKTIYDLLPMSLRALKPVGRLDKDSSGLLLLTTDGELAHNLTHPSFQKTKLYEVTLDKDLAPLHRQMISELGVLLDDGPSRFILDRLEDGSETAWRVTMHEGRNRQIRRTFSALGYTVIRLHRTQFGNYTLPDTLAVGTYVTV